VHFFSFFFSSNNPRAQTNPDPVAFLEQSYSVENPPRPFAANTILDPNLVQYYIVLHDGSTGDEAVADEVLAKVQAKFGKKNCTKLVINTMEGDKEASDGMKDLWQTFVKAVPPRKQRRSSASTAVDAPLPKERKPEVDAGSASVASAEPTASAGDKSDATEPDPTDPLQKTASPDDLVDPLQRE
jgi:hypothetical protein